MFRRTFCAVVGALPFTIFKTRPAVNDSDRDAVMVAMGEAAMCWEHPELAGVFDSEQAENIGNRLRQHFADGIGDFATARRRVCDDMASDEGLRVAYQSNIAMAIFDNSALNHESCNRLADEIMRVVFEA